MQFITKAAPKTAFFARAKYEHRVTAEKDIIAAAHIVWYMHTFIVLFYLNYHTILRTCNEIFRQPTTAELLRG